VLDAVFLVATVALFALVALVAKGVEKLGPPASTLAPRGTSAARSDANAAGTSREDGDRS
jgi:hypothetical protein